MSYSPRHKDNEASVQKSGGSKSQKVLVISVVAILLAAAVIALVVLLTSGGSQGQKKVIHTEGNRHDVTVAANGGSAGGDFEGLWQLDDVTSYEFDGSGRGTMHTAKDFKFSYSADNGSLFIDFDSDDGMDCEYKYTISGLTLNLTRGSSTYILTKQI